MQQPICYAKTPLWIQLQASAGRAASGAKADRELIAHASRLPQVIAGAKRWLMPWASVLVLTGGSAFLVNGALGRTLVAEPAATHSLPDPLNRASANAGFRWVAVSLVDASGGRQESLTCMVATDRISVDALVVEAHDLDAIADGLCTSPVGDRSALGVGQ